VFFDPAFGRFLTTRYAKPGFAGVKHYFGGVAVEA